MMDANNPSDTRDLYFRLLGYVRLYWRTFTLALVTMALLAATEPAVPALLQPFLDGSFAIKEIEYQWLIPALIILLFLVKGILSFTSSVSSNWVANKVVMDLRHDMFRNLILLPASFYHDNSSGTLISKLTYDTSQVALASTRCISIIVKDALAIVGLILYMMYTAWELALIVLFIAPVVAIAVRRIAKRLRSMSRKVQQSMGAITHVAQEAIDCQKAVKIFAGQSYETNRFWEAINRSRQFTMKVVLSSAANVPIIQLIMAFALATVIYFASLQAAAGTMSVGEFVSFFTAMILLLAPLKRLTGINEHLQRGLAACSSIFELIDAQPEQDFGALDIGRAQGEIEFDNVSVCYQKDHGYVLRNVSFDIHAGETVAIVGASGSGKSTLVNLIPKFYHANQGTIRVDNKDIEEIALKSLRENISLVTQEVVLFNDTVKNNIAYGAMRNCSELQIMRATEAAHAMEFIRKMPDGFDTMIGEDGMRLSGGQRQRLAIARALLKDAPILILDEATSSLDTASERAIQQALETLRKGRTCIIIAHRLSTIENADRIVVMQGGRIVEIGDHQELIRSDGVYKELHKIQFAEPSEKTAALPLTGKAV